MEKEENQRVQGRNERAKRARRKPAMGKGKKEEREWDGTLRRRRKNITR